MPPLTETSERAHRRAVIQYDREVNDSNEELDFQLKHVFNNLLHRTFRSKGLNTTCNLHLHAFQFQIVCLGWTFLLLRSPCVWTVVHEHFLGCMVDILVVDCMRKDWMPSDVYFDSTWIQVEFAWFRTINSRERWCEQTHLSSSTVCHVKTFDEPISFVLPLCQIYEVLDIDGLDLNVGSL